VTKVDVKSLEMALQSKVDVKSFDEALKTKVDVKSLANVSNFVNKVKADLTNNQDQLSRIEASADETKVDVKSLEIALQSKVDNIHKRLDEFDELLKKKADDTTNAWPTTPMSTPFTSAWTSLRSS
jgi:biopolymer transport protein ExbB/TolQ